jgi:hypothetical protein
MLVGQLTNVGAVLSLTVTVNVQVAVLPEPSVATLVTVVVPVLKKLPEAGVETTLTVPQLSVAVTLKLTVAPQLPEAEATDIFCGQVITGKVVSTTVTTKLQLVELPNVSVATLVTVVLPTGNTLPDAGVETIVTGELHVLAVTLKFTVAPQVPTSLETEIFEGHVMIKLLPGCTSTTSAQLAVLPNESVTVK